MATDIEYALMAGASYISTRADINQFPVPENWLEKVGKREKDDATGFEATYFTKGNEIVISYAGTGPGLTNPDWKANFALAGGVGAKQLLQAAEYYLSIKNDPRYQGATITLTGHSLGGGLAALIAVFFNEQATTFDPAPFRASANNDIRNQLLTHLATLGYTTGPAIAALSDFTSSLPAAQAGPSETPGIRGERNVQIIRVAGEAISDSLLLRFADPVGANLPQVLTHGGTGASDVDLHSQALLAALLQSDQTAASSSNPQQTLSKVTYKLTDLLGMIFDSKLFYNDPNNKDAPLPNLLEHLVRHEAGLRDPATGVTTLAADAMVTRFTKDLWKLAQEGGMTMSDGAATTNRLSKALTAFAMQKYYEEVIPTGATPTELFTGITGGLRFDMADVSKKFAAAFQANDKLTLKDAKGFDLYFADYLKQDSVTDGERTLITSILPILRDWYIQAGTTALNTADTQNRNAFLLGGTGADTLTGGSGADLLIGNGSADTLSGGQGNDTLLGGLGNDSYVIGDTADSVVENAAEGTDTVQSSVSYTLGANLENLNLTGTAAIDGTGNDLNNTLTGNLAANTLSGGAGNDTLNGGAGADTLIGHLGNDIYVVDDLGDVVVESAGEGSDTVRSYLTCTLGAELENLTLLGTAAIDGAGNDVNNVLTGNVAANTLSGGVGNDTLNGAAGADTLIGGIGNDSYTVDNAGDVVVELTDEGLDLVNSSVSHTLADNVERLTLTGTASIDGTGNELDNLLTGNAAANVLSGGDGNDTLNGAAGADTLVGGLGDDAYTVDNISDVVVEAAGEGADLVSASVSYSIADNVENLTLTGSAAISGTGNALDNVLTGNSGANALSGGAGNDTLNGAAGADSLTGGEGDDIYSIDNVGDAVVENAGEGIDQVNASVTHTLAAEVENLTLTGTASISGTGNALDNIITGTTGNNTLTGDAGNDMLDGKAGTDVLVGGSGNDTYVLGRGYGSDTVRENDATSGNADAAHFLAGIAADQIWLRHVGNNLQASIIGTTDKLTFENWYLGSNYHVEQFKTADGKLLLDSQVENLVQAMAAFAPPAASQTSLPPTYQDSLAAVIAVNWQ